MSASAQQRTALGWISVASAALALVTGRWWLLAVSAGVWWWSRSSGRGAPRLTILPGGISTSGAVADARYNPTGQLPGAAEPNYEPSNGPGGPAAVATESSTAGRGVTCAGI